MVVLQRELLRRHCGEPLTRAGDLLKMVLGVKVEPKPGTGTGHTANARTRVLV